MGTLNHLGVGLAVSMGTLIVEGLEHSISKTGVTLGKVSLVGRTLPKDKVADVTVTPQP